MSDEKLTNVINNWVDNNKDDITDLLKKMVSYKSINHKFLSDPKESEANELQNFLEDYLDELNLDNLETDKWEVYPNQPNLIATLKGNNNNNTLILNGHIDVVPAGDEEKWSYNPWNVTEKDGKLFGRGTGDMKAGVVCNIMVLKFIKEMGIELDSDLQLHIVVDEEAGGGGTRSAIKKGYVGKAAIITEPTNTEVVLAEGGLEWVRVIVRGLGGHAGWRFSQIYPGYKEGAVNAIEKAKKILDAISELEKDRGLSKSHDLMPPGIATISPGVIIGGAGEKNGHPETLTNPAMVPDYCIMEFDLKYLPSEKQEDVKKEFEDLIWHVSQTDSWLKDNLPEVEWNTHGLSFPPVDTDPNHPLVKNIEKSRKQFGIETNYTGFEAVCDAAFYAGSGTTPLIYGPTGGNYHGEDEFVDIDSMYEVTKVLILTVLNWYKINK